MALFFTVRAKPLIINYLHTKKNAFFFTFFSKKTAQMAYTLKMCHK